MESDSSSGTGTKGWRSAGGIDVVACLRMGATGALGAVPGTVCAHPFDVLKIRMQTTNMSAGGYAQAVRYIMGSAGSSGSSKSMMSGRHGFAGFYRGLFPAVEQRVVARGPMFLFSELYTQQVEMHTSLSGTGARFVGSVGSGYTVGYLAGLAEYRKKLLSQGVISREEARWDRLWKTATKANMRGPLFRRLHAAGLCSAIYDSTFFSTQHSLQQNSGWSAPASYGCAAAAAVVVAFAADTGVARMMVVGPDKPVPPLRSVVLNIVKENSRGKGVLGWLSGARAAYRGVPARVCEFFVSYVVTGAVSVYVVKWFA